MTKNLLSSSKHIEEAMQERTILLRIFAEPLRRKLVAGGLAVAIGSGFLVWSRYGATPPATTAVLSFDAGAARQAEPGVMNENAKEPAVALAQSILSDEAVKELLRQTGLPFTTSENSVVEFRSRLDMAQTSVGLLRVNYKDTDKKLSAAVANAVANMLVAWLPAPVRQGPRLAPPALAKSRRPRHSLEPRSPALSTLESQLAVANRKLAALYARAIASQKAKTAPPPSNTNNDADETERLRLERTRLMQAIVAEKRREAAQPDQTASDVGDSALAAQTVAGQIWQRPFTLVRLAGNAGTGQSGSGLLWYWPLAGILCGLLYLGGVIWRYRPVESAPSLEPPVLNNKLSTEGATEYGGNLIQIEDRWTKEVLKSLSLTGIGREDEAFAPRQKPVSVDKQQQADSGVPGLQGQAHDDEVLRMAPSEETRISLATGDTDTDVKAIKLATTVTEEVKAQLSKVVRQLDRNVEIHK